MPSIGGFIATIEQRGSCYAREGILRGWMPVPGGDQQSEPLLLDINGQLQVVGKVTYDGTPLPLGGGYVARHLFEINLPRETFGRQVRVSLRTEKAMPVGVEDIVLDIDDNGDAFLAELNDELRESIPRALDLVKRSKLGLANLIYQQICCAEFFADHANLLVAARVAADIFDVRAADILLGQALINLPARYDFLSKVGKIYLKLDRFDQAQASFESAIALDPKAFDARNGWIKAIIGKSDWTKALLEAHRLRRELATDSKSYAELSGTIAWLYLNISQPERALVEAVSARHLHPDVTRLMQMQADALVRLSRYSEAVEIYRQALVPNSKDPLLRKRIASALMLLGEFGDAADQDANRLATPTFIKLNNFPENLPLWRGDIKFDGKLLVWSEVNFGVGQNLMHASLLPDLIALGIDIVLEAEARLVPVFAAAFPTIEVLEQALPGQTRGEWLKDVAYHVPIGSLARVLRRERRDFACSKPFLSHSPQRAQALRQELLAASGGKRFLVGFSWTSSNPYVGDEKSVPLALLLKALDVPGVGLVNLQYGDHAATIQQASDATGVSVLQSPSIDRTDDLVGMCDLIAGLDMVICIGHTTAHLAGGLGVQNLVLVPSSPFAHWLGEGEACVWYPHSRVLRQPADQRGDWAIPLAQAQKYLAHSVLGVGLPPLDDPVLAVDAGTGHSYSLEVLCRNALRIAMTIYDYQRVAQIIPVIEERFGNNVELLTLVGDCQYRMGNFESSLSAYRTAMDCGGDRVELTVKRVNVLLECYELQLAESLLRQLLETDPQLLETRQDLLLLQTNIMACQGRYVTVIERLRPVYENDRQNPDIAFTLANAYSMRGEHDKARLILSTALQQSVSSDVAVALGISIGRAGMPELGLSALNAARPGTADTLAEFWRGQFAKDKVKRRKDSFKNGELTLPSESETRVTVFVCMDTSYCLRYLGSIAASIAENSPEANLHVHLVNPHEQALERLDAVASMMGPGRLSYGIETAKLGNYTPEQRKTYFASIRFVRLAELMEQSPGVFFVMDVDNLVRSDLSSCLTLARGADVLIRNRFSLSPHLAVAACGIVLANTDAARDFMSRTAGYILDAFHSGHIAWFLDQIALTMALKGKETGESDGLRVAQLPRSLLDWDFSRESLVWTGKGKRRLANERYQAEYHRFVVAFDHAMLQLA